MQTQFDQNDQQNVPVALRAHTILGVCEAIGEDFGFNPIWLRLPLAASVLISPLWAVVGYLALGLVVLASRLLFPRPKVTQVVAESAGQPAPANEQQELARAA
jgi:phage shock protein PspC (stress-responsive transcriptional regulator)